MNWLKRFFTNSATQTVLAAALGGAVTATADAASTKMTSNAPIDWSHLADTAKGGAIVGVAALWKSKPGSQK